MGATTGTQSRQRESFVVRTNAHNKPDAPKGWAREGRRKRAGETPRPLRATQSSRHVKRYEQQRYTVSGHIVEQPSNVVSLPRFTFSPAKTAKPCNTYGYDVSPSEGESMATVHKGYRLDVELVASLDAWAETHGMNQADAVRHLLAAALDADEAKGKSEESRATATAELRELYGTHIKDLRANVSTLTAQLATKDAQIAEKDEQLRRLQDIADHAQMLQAAHVAGTITEGEPVAVAVEQQETQRGGFWGWVARKIEGR